MERLFGGKVFLEVWVRSKRGWADDEAHADAVRAIEPPCRRLTHARPRAQPLRRDDQPAFVLHSYPVPRDQPDRRGVDGRDGRVALVARGAQAAALGAARAAAAFQPLLLSWSGQRELKTLLRAEWRGGLPLVGGSALLCGFYLNELLLKLLPREDPHPRLFATTTPRSPSSRRARAGGGAAAVRAARCSPNWATRCRSRTKPTPARRWIPRPLLLRLRSRPAAPPPAAGRARCPQVRGATLLALADGTIRGAETAAEAKRLMREVLDHYLEQRGVDSRRVVQRSAGARRGAKRRTTTVIELGVNIDHVATVRQARRTYEPDPVWAAVEAHLGGADGITVHLREDRRHIQDEDVRRLRELVHIKLNLEMAATDEMVGIACG